jgi:pimeloyl-ACP methyl ester carboxylesterase
MSLRANAGYAPGPDYDVHGARESLRAITAPTLIVVGERDALTGVAVADRFAEVLPSAHVAVVKGAGHFPWVDEPDAFRNAVESFLSADS